MNDVLRALSISAGILFLVVIVIVAVTMVAVKRGEASHGETEHSLQEATPIPKETAPVVTTKPTKAAAPESDEISVMQILLLGTGLFVLTVLFLVALSLIQHSV
jgi:hypothetical protein